MGIAMDDFKFAWIIFAIGFSSGTTGGLFIALLGVCGIWISVKDEE